MRNFFLLMPISKGNNMPIGRVQQSSKNSIDAVECIICNANSKGLGSSRQSPYFSAMGNMAKRMQDYGADALVLFNPFYQPDFDINSLSLLHNLQFSESNEIRLPLLWIAMLYGRVPVSLAASTGVQSSIEVIKYILAVPISL